MSAEELLKDLDLSVDEGDADMQISNICTNMRDGKRQ